MLIKFHFLKCDDSGDRIVCEGERNFQNRKIVVSNLNMDGNIMTKSSIRNKEFKNVGCKYAVNSDGGALECFSI